MGVKEGTKTTLSSSLLSKSGWAVVGLFYVAENGLRYHKLKKGVITKD